jgi:hypothetical protein
VQPTPGSNGGLRPAFGSFFAMLGSLGILSLVLGFVAIPRTVVGPLNLFLAMLYLGVPILAIYRVASAPWTKKLALLFLLGGVVGWGLFLILEGHTKSGLANGVAVALSQIGIQTACVGLGALLGTLIPDKNLLIPIAIFLAVYDVFLVRTDIGPTHQLMMHAPAILKSTGVRIPAASSHHGSGLVPVGAFVGDADVVSLAAFFIALFRFKLRTRETFLVMLPTLILYLIVVELYSLQLPALVPIGAVILLVNYREFNLTKEEKLGTGLIACLAVGLLTWALNRPRIEPGPPPGPAPSAASQPEPISPAKPGPGAPGRRRSSRRIAPTNI